jgi:diacylglycerol kinase (ATP)
VNPAAGGRHSDPSDLPRILERLRERGFELDVRETGAESPTSADLAAEAVERGYDACLVAGGDGTVQPAATKLLGTGVVLGILPFGSFMNITRGLGIPLEAKDAAEVIVARHVVTADVGEAGEHEKVFFETAGVGLDAHVFGAARLAERGLRRHALRRLWRAATQGTHRVTAAVDGAEHAHRVFQILVANSPYYLWSFPVAPDAAMDDGRLEVAVYARMGRLQLLRALVGLWRSGEYPVAPIIYSGAKVELRSAEPLPVHADGKVVGSLPITIRCRPGALAVYAPPRR